MKRGDPDFFEIFELQLMLCFLENPHMMGFERVPDIFDIKRIGGIDVDVDFTTVERVWGIDMDLPELERHVVRQLVVDRLEELL